MKRCIIFNQDNSIAAVIYPRDDYADTIESLAEKDVPFGKSYKIIDMAELPQDRTFRNAWEFKE